MDEVLRKITAARTRLILDKPFLGALVLRLPLQETRAPWCPTTATDAKTLYYNPDFIESLNISEVQFVLSHDALHCGLSHFSRREYRDQHRWDVACDHAVNQLLLEDQLEAPQGSLLNNEYAGMSAEEIYPFIPADTEEQPLDQHLYDAHESTQNDEHQNEQRESESDADQKTKNSQQQQSESESESESESGSDTSPSESEQAEHNAQYEQQETSNQHSPPASPNAVQQDTKSMEDHSIRKSPSPLTQSERDQLHTQWQQRLAGAAQQATAAGKMSGSVARLVERLLRSTVPWRTVLARFMSGSSKVDYNLSRPTNRREGEAIRPSLHARQIDIVIAIDTSGSIEGTELNDFVSEVNAIKGLVNARITLLACDAELDENGPWRFEPWDQLKMPSTLIGSGGTDFRPVFNWINLQSQQPDLIVYFTDAKGRFPTQPATSETLWLVKGSAPVPWGQRIQLN